MDFEREAAAFRAAVRQAGRGARQRYSAAVRRQGVAYLAPRRASGATASAAARELAVRRDTLLWWTRPRRAFKPGFVPVTVVDGPADQIVVRGPHGVRVEGLDVAGVAELLRRLS